MGLILLGLPHKEHTLPDERSQYLVFFEASEFHSLVHNYLVEIQMV